MYFFFFMNLFCPAYASPPLRLFFFFFFNIDSVGYIAFLGDVLRKVFEVEPVHGLPAARACILLYILWG